ncbi:hypothetical protein [Amycolatopsis sp. H20-H5]|uniref:hypothetical protein n=1 Tax=Amycolatopsis sp. H20-H5 TaxID=3046309 RepID=UPI002DBE9FB6|nr:hypothetical protein [Amycolatopsis sp. H20-H5]MEC3975490.1 hypothetical protein [Amycolatopsis sp. H20-H5]
MNRIESAAGLHAADLTLMEAQLPSSGVSCTPTVALAVLVGTAAGYAVCRAILAAVDPNVPDSPGQVAENGMPVGDLLHTRHAAVASI